MGKVACQVIKIGKGVCGTAAKRKETVLVKDVEAFPGHIACDGDSKSEIVVPIVVGEKVGFIPRCEHQVCCACLCPIPSFFRMGYKSVFASLRFLAYPSCQYRSRRHGVLTLAVCWRDRYRLYRIEWIR